MFLLVDILVEILLLLMLNLFLTTVLSTMKTTLRLVLTSKGSCIMTMFLLDWSSWSRNEGVLPEKMGRSLLIVTLCHIYHMTLPTQQKSSNIYNSLLVNHGLSLPLAPSKFCYYLIFFRLLQFPQTLVCIS